jgi:serine/threonine protein kinase
MSETDSTLDSTLSRAVRRPAELHGLDPRDLLARALEPERRADEQWQPPAKIIGRYRLVKELGKGGFGMVWLAEQTEPIRREVALKVIKLGMDSAEIIARFAAERQALALMDHPNIAAVLDAGTTDRGRPYFVMELVRGVPITDYCDEQRLPIRERLRLFILVCQAMQHAHQKAILHRDLKPSNILVTEVDGQPVPKVIDFGIAKALGAAEDDALRATLARTQEGMIVGTPQYMSPEQAGVGADMDTRSDIYTLGVILCQLLTGDTPLPRAALQKASLEEALRLIREADPVRPSSRIVPSTEAVREIATARGTEPAKLTRALQGDLDWITLKALEKERDRRYESAAALAQDLERHLRHEPVEAGPPGTFYRLRKMVRRNRLAVGAVTAIAGLLVVGIAVSTWQAVRAGKAEGLATERLHQSEAEKKRADSEARTAKAVNEFLRFDLLMQAVSENQADRDEEPNPNLTVREAVDRAAKHIDHKFSDQPLVEAAIRESIGLTYEDLGQPDRALPHLRRALDLHLKNLGPENRVTLGNRSDLTGVLLALAKYTEAEKEIRGALEVMRRVLGEEDRFTLITRGRLAAALQEQRKYGEAEKEYRAVLAARERVLGAEHPETLSSRNNLANLLQAQRRYAEAEKEHRAVLAIRERVLGAEHPATLASRSNLANTLYYRGKPAEAEREHRAVLAIEQRILGPEHPSTVASRTNLANALDDQGKYAEAEQERRAALDVLERRLGAEHPTTQMSRANKINALLDQGRSAEAETELRALLAIRERVLGPEHPDTLESQFKLGRALRAQRKYGEAAKEFRMALEGRRHLLGADHSTTLNTWHNLANVLDDQHEHEEAEKEYREMIPLMERALGAEDDDTLGSRNDLALALAAQGKDAEAEQEYRAVLPLMEHGLGAKHRFTANCNFNFARFLEIRKRGQEALPFARKALAGYQNFFGTEHADTKDAQTLVDRLSSLAPTR